jgi:hypothetical protein
MISRSVEGLLSTHPSVSDRVGALMQYAGGRQANLGSQKRPTQSVFGDSRSVPTGATGITSGGAVSFGRRQPRFVGA